MPSPKQDLLDKGVDKQRVFLLLHMFPTRRLASSLSAAGCLVQSSGTGTPQMQFVMTEGKKKRARNRRKEPNLEANIYADLVKDLNS